MVQIFLQQYLRQYNLRIILKLYIMTEVAVDQRDARPRKPVSFTALFKATVYVRITRIYDLLTSKPISYT